MQEGRSIGKAKSKKLRSTFRVLTCAECRARMSDGGACGNEHWLGLGRMMLVWVVSLGRCGPQIEDLLGLRKDVFHWSIVYQGGREFSFIYKSKRRIRGNLYKEWGIFCMFVRLFEFRSRFGRTKRVGSRVDWDTQFMKKCGDKRMKTERKLARWNWTFHLKPHAESSPCRFWSQQFIIHSLIAHSLHPPEERSPWKKRSSKKTCLQQRDWCNARSMHGCCTHHTPLDVTQSDLIPL